MSNNWYDSGSWYEPLQTGETEVNDKKAKRKAKGITPLRVAALIFIILLLIIASSVAFSVKNVTAVSTDPTNTLPSDYKRFFEGYFTSTTSEKAKINMPRYEGSVDFRAAVSESEAEELSLQELYKRCVSSIVGIKSYAGDTPVGYAWGSGVILSEDGVILTNCHLVEERDRVVVILNDGEEYEAELIGADSIGDIAVLKIDAQNLPSAEFGDSNALTIGDRVAAIGNPLSSNFSLTLTDGIISGIERGMKYNGHIMNLLQTNTAINNGNSGGALFDMYGRVIGITNMKMISSYSSIEGIGFAIPSATAIGMVNSIMETGAVSGRTSIGITVGPIPTEIAEYYDIPEGLYVSEVHPASAAYGQIKIGDIILEADGVSVKANSELSEIKDNHSVGETIKLAFWRGGETFEADIELVDTNDLY